ncbi:MAG: radical SAM protein [Deltaproteobacteria bacterium]|nr:radical SAM protein [Deltaproteobacteria bacterium]
MSHEPLLLINPWIYDFAAYDFFARPLGLLYLAGLLEARGFAVHLVDCLDAPQARAGRFGTGRYPKEILPTPSPLKDIPRRYGRYGISEEEFQARLSRTPYPRAILVTSLMTYWYPGVTAAIRLARERFPRVPVILGGIYATLCPDHARRHSGADLVLSGPGEDAVPAALASLGLVSEDPDEKLDLNSFPYPALHLLNHLTFIPLLTSRGCPLTCSYCASRLLQPRHRRRTPSAVAAELAYWQGRLSLPDVAFYDDALLARAEDHLLPILEELARRGLNFRCHTPNGLHARFITRDVARWLKRADFRTLRLGVETTAVGETRVDEKLAQGELEAAVAYLREAGFRREEMGVYLLLGLPCQDDGELIQSIRRVKELGATPVLAQYSPIPGTDLWPQAAACSRYDLAFEPLYHNSSIFPCWLEFSWERLTRLKRLAGGEEG